MSQVQKRVSMSEKKKIAAEKRKATMEAKNQARIEDQRRQKIDKFHKMIKEDHEQRLEGLIAISRATASAALKKALKQMVKKAHDKKELKKALANEVAWVEHHKAIHAKYCAELTKTRLGEDLYMSMIGPNTGFVAAVIRETVEDGQPQEEMRKKDTDFFDSIKGVKNMKYQLCRARVTGDTTYNWHVTFDLDL